jgi:glutamate racemase
MTNTDKMFKKKKIGLFDSGIGGFSVLHHLFQVMPEAQYYYVSDDAYAPYGLKSDDFITDRAIFITKELLKCRVDIIVVACNTATAASIVKLRECFPSTLFVGVEPYLNVYYKIPEGLLPHEKKMMVLTTESMGKSERFKRLKERLDPKAQIDHYSLKNLARLVDDYYYHPEHKEEFEKNFDSELSFLKPLHYSYAILGCTHYPLVRAEIENLLQLKTISPCAYVAQRVTDLVYSGSRGQAAQDLVTEDFFYYYSTSHNLWIQKKRESFYGPFQRK